ncbi:MAG: hypothetical protein PHY31_01920 [Smithellaceae bacterium]|nr:hypothetical protein [Smithellaceae bacterium]
MKRLWIMVLCVALLFAIPRSSTADTTQNQTSIRVTIVAGGVVSGVYIFFYLSLGYADLWGKNLPESTALLNGGPEGWRMSFPQLRDLGNNNTDPVPGIELIKVRF